MFLKRFAIAVFTLLLSSTTAYSEEWPKGFVPANPPVAMPAFVFEDSHGHTLRLDDFKGRPVLLNLWATWCGPCVKEMPSLDHLQTLLADTKLVVIALDQEHNSADLTAAFFKQHDIHLGIYSDSSARLGSLLHARGLPMSYLIDANGMLSGVVMGGTDWTAPDMVAFLRVRLSSPIATIPDKI